jgi:hypothetical protein
MAGVPVGVSRKSSGLTFVKPLLRHACDTESVER